MLKSQFLVIGLTMLQFSAMANQNFHAKFNAENNNWIEFEDDFNVDPFTFINEYKNDLGLNNDYSFEFQSVHSDDLGFNHFSFIQRYKNVPIDGVRYQIHQYENKIKTANGRLIKDLNQNAIPALNSLKALNNAMTHYGAKGYWENPEMEEFIKDLKNDPNASFAPIPQLVFANPEFSQIGAEYKLAWKIDLYLDMKEDHKIAYIDAVSGNFWFEIDGCQTTNSQGIADTRYSGTQSIYTDSMGANSYRLFEDTRAVFVHTRNHNTGTDNNVWTEFLDSDNIWDTVNAQMDDAAYDVHWGTGEFLDYFLEKHGRNSFDGNGTPVISRVHWDNGYFNAFWNGVYATYGDGNGNPLTSIDVVAHELGHGVTGTSAGLVYAYEPGALNESFSDIFGSAVEFYSGDPNANWLIGRSNFTLRSMSNPNSFNQPDTYKGASWYTGSGDNGGVHTNSGVQNFWYYLLVNGGSGVNDIGDSYSVSAIGQDKADSIAYRNLNVYLSPNSQHDDARIGSILAAEDIYGVCSNEAIQTALAWYAVGVGPHPLWDDFTALQALSPKSKCELGTAETMEFQFRFNESYCGLRPNVGDTVILGYKIDNQAPVLENYILTAVPNNNDIFTYTFSNTADLTSNLEYDLEFFVDFATDIRVSNNSFDKEVLSASYLSESFKITMEKWFFPSLLDSFYSEKGYNAYFKPTVNSANTGQWGIQLSSLKFQDTSELQLPADTSDNFNLNKGNIASFCICVDASAADSLTLKFDMKQTYSKYWNNNFGWQFADLSSSMRLMLNGNQFGPQFHPTTYDSDPYSTYTMDLNAYAGTAVQICFETQSLIPFSNDPEPQSPGDRTLLDNIEVIMTTISSIDNPIDYSDILLYPNPVHSVLYVRNQKNKSLPKSYEITDLSGRTLERGIIENNEIDVSLLKSGMYIIHISSSESEVIKQFFKSNQ